jgi:hypothetical protein
MQTATKHTNAAQIPARDPDDLLDRPEIAKPPYRIPVATQCSWFSLNRYGWRDICIKLGARVVVRRRDLERWLESRRGIVV